MSKEALEQCIEKYKSQITCLKNHLGEQLIYKGFNRYLFENDILMCVGEEDCSLCDLYFDDEDNFICCKECPIYKNTKSKFCNNSPFEKIRNYIDNFMTVLDRNGIVEILIVSKKLIELFEEELEFLIKVKETYYGN